MATPVYLEIGTTKTFACTFDWPGWCRSGRNEEAALEALGAYAERYRPIPEAAGIRFPKSAADDFEVLERIPGDTTTTFGAPGKPAAADATPLTRAQAERLAVLVGAAWAYFDEVAAHTPAELRKGPRGGGRDRDKMVDHVVAAEAGYFRKVGLRTHSRAEFLDILRAAREPQPELATKTWPYRYAARRVAWHAVDHAWEMQDRSA